MALKIPTMSFAELMVEVQPPLADDLSGKNFAVVEAMVCMVVHAEIGFEVSVLQLLGVLPVGAP